MIVIPNVPDGTQFYVTLLGRAIVEFIPTI
jgi:hypothetical protein